MKASAYIAAAFLVATSSAALFLLGETESYFHGEIVEGTWAGFQSWVPGAPSRPASAASAKFSGEGERS